MHWCDRRTAKANLGTALRALGWKLFGWKDDQSDSMADYYDPESWAGIATKGEAVVVVDIGPADRWSLNRSGTPEIRRVPTAGPDCSRCNGAGEDPDGWTLTRARQDPRVYHAWETRAIHGENSNIVNLMPGVVSPIPFDDDGRRRCVSCGGAGHLPGTPREEIAFVWPEFQANPPRRLWHVEAAGKILASGIGLKGCLRTEAVKDQDHLGGWRTNNVGAATLAAKINSKATREPRVGTRAAGDPGDGPMIAENAKLGGVEIRFPSKPSEETRGHLKAAGWRWSRRAECWYKSKEAGTLEEARVLTEAIQ